MFIVFATKIKYTGLFANSFLIFETLRVKSVIGTYDDAPAIGTLDSDTLLIESGSSTSLQCLLLTPKVY